MSVSDVAIHSSTPSWLNYMLFKLCVNTIARAGYSIFVTSSSIIMRITALVWVSSSNSSMINNMAYYVSDEILNSQVA